MKNSLLIDEPPFHILPALAETVGFSEAAILQEIHYYLNAQVNTDFHEGRHWVENVFEHLQERFFFCHAEDIGYMLDQLEQSGILMAFSKPPEDFNQDFSKAIFHTINYQLLNRRDDAPVRLVPVTPFIEHILPATGKNTQPSFSAKIHVKGLDVYTMAAEDPAHFLACELVLEIQEERSGSGETTPEGLGSKNVVCHYPKIADGRLKEFVWEDPTLYEILMAVFRMKIMQQLLSFCATHHASHLIVFADSAREDELEIYRDFLIHQGQTIALKGEKAGLIVQINQETLDDWIGFMEGVIIKFRQTLWRDQKANPAIQHYLKSRDLSDF